MVKKLSELALLIPEAKIFGNDVEISGIEHDSRKVTAKNLFVCMEGAHVDGHKFIPQAVERGAVAILTTRKNFEPPENISVLVVPDMLNALAVIVPYFYDYPARAMRVVGVTGTNGKTTTTYMLREIFSTAGFKVGLIGTIQILIGDESFPNPNTTPNVIDLQHIFADMRAKNVQIVVMEVSSHALAENRIAGVEFDTAIFTNLTQDHLDFHGTMENYLRAKAKLFDMVSRKGRKQNKSAVVNVDDAAGEEILRHCHCKKISYAIENPADLQAIDLNVKSDGMKLQLNSSPVPSPLSLNLHVTGLFNVYNVLATIGAALAENISPEVIKRALENFHGVPGRFERIFSSAPFEVIVDYAHTPDGVKNVLETARQIVTGKIITVFGCGGDRDNKKRPIMGKLAAELSDVVIATSDNPRTENPEKILDDIEVGIREVIGEKFYERIADRHSAIFRAIELANSGDVVLILGKGHENYQILNTGTIHFDDREVAREAIDKL
ncbi:MAG: UDP-N-acetylmuramoyl-L-alanyl-D-glutamate--2,6-diaminopimelate ligase [Selenomonadaceae bacterium]|nr:UDP-N-acetylmuramoyl-L-alanyl-D-glutamate--2,6-diaminopimelate ligase [Selenomonadaceae bacterium]